MINGQLRAGFATAAASRQSTTRQMVAEHNGTPNGSRELAGGKTITVVKEGARSETNGQGTKRRHELCQGLTFKRLEVFGRGFWRKFEPRPMCSGSGTDDARGQIEEV